MIIIGYKASLRMRFNKSRLYESAFLYFIGISCWICCINDGNGGAFLMVPAMIYIIGMPVKLIPEPLCSLLYSLVL